MDEIDDAGAVARLARFAAELYRVVPLEGGGLAGQAEELAHAADLDLLAAALDAGADVDLDDVLQPRDIRVVCQVLLDVRRAPNQAQADEVRLAREHFPEVEAETLEPLEGLIGFYTGLLQERSAPVRIDLHAHTQPFSTCSSLQPDDLLRLAKERGLDGVCLTEHDRLWPLAEVRRLSQLHELVVLRGMEVTTEVGHILVFGLDEAPAGMFAARTLIRRVREMGGVAVLAHPARAGQPPIAPAQMQSLFDAIEVLNGSDGPGQNRAAVAMASGLPVPGIAGSDCHAPAEVATVATVLPHWVSNESELVAALRLGQHSVEDRRPDARTARRD